MPFRPRFDCLWCGRTWEVRSEDDLEGWATLCPECLGKADDNGFLRARLRAGLRERAAAGTPPPEKAADAEPPGTATTGNRADIAHEAGPPGAAGLPATAAGSPATAAGPSATPPTRAADHDDWYLRRGRFSRGPLYDGPWAMELEEVTRWLDAQPIDGTIVELGAGSGWWSGLLAEKGELWLYDSDGAALDAARQRLVSHGLRAHIHQRDPLAPPDKQVDAVVAAYLLSAAGTLAALATRVGVVAGWLKPGGSFVFIEAAPTTDTAPTDGPAGPLWPREPEALAASLAEHGFATDGLRATRRSFVMGRASRKP